LDIEPSENEKKKRFCCVNTREWAIAITMVISSLAMVFFMILAIVNIGQICYDQAHICVNSIVSEKCVMKLINDTVNEPLCVWEVDTSRTYVVSDAKCELGIEYACYLPEDSNGRCPKIKPMCETGEINITTVIFFMCAILLGIILFCLRSYIKSIRK
jgi:hypothetical protein